MQFHPELKGLPDPQRGDRVWRSASMGSGQMLAESFLAHAYRLLFGSRVPRLDRAKLVVSWTLDHVIRYNTGGIGGKQQMAVLEKGSNGPWQARHVDAEGEIKQQVDELESYISNYPETIKQRATGSDVPDAREVLEKDESAARETQDPRSSPSRCSVANFKTIASA